MPEIARFYGLVIKMFFKPKEHEPSHIHALYGEYLGEFNIRTMEMIQGDLPKKAQELVKEWPPCTRMNYNLCGIVSRLENCLRFDKGCRYDSAYMQHPAFAGLCSFRIIR